MNLEVEAYEGELTELRRLARQSEIVKIPTGYTVILKVGSRVVKNVELEGKSLYYAHDLAENWCTGVIRDYN